MRVAKEEGGGLLSKRLSSYLSVSLLYLSFDLRRMFVFAYLNVGSQQVQSGTVRYRSLLSTSYTLTIRKADCLQLYTKHSAETLIAKL